MKQTFERFTDVLVDIYRADEDVTMGANPGCECGCGGDSYDWDEIFEEDERAQAIKDLAIEHLPFTEDDLGSMAYGWEHLGDLPDPQWDWYFEGEGDYEADLEYHARDVDENGYYIAWAITKLTDFDWSLLEVEV